MSSCRNANRGAPDQGILQDNGHTTLSASNFDQALALVEGTERIDLIFTDIGLQSDIQAGLMLAQEAAKRKIGPLNHRPRAHGRDAGNVR